MSIAPLDGPQLVTILEEAEDRYHRLRKGDWGPYDDGDQAIGAIAEDAIPTETQALLELATDTMSLMFEEPECDTTEPFRCLWKAAVERVEEHLVEARDWLARWGDDDEEGEEDEEGSGNDER